MYIMSVSESFHLQVHVILEKVIFSAAKIMPQLQFRWVLFCKIVILKIAVHRIFAISYLPWLQ